MGPVPPQPQVAHHKEHSLAGTPGQKALFPISWALFQIAALPSPLWMSEWPSRLLYTLILDLSASIANAIAQKTLRSTISSTGLVKGAKSGPGPVFKVTLSHTALQPLDCNLPFSKTHPIRPHQWTPPQITFSASKHSPNLYPANQMLSCNSPPGNLSSVPLLPHQKTRGLSHLY